MSIMAVSLPSCAQDNASSPTIPPSSLVTAADVGAADRVLVIGRNVIEQVVALAHAGCRAVSSLRAESSYPRDEQVDVLWLTGIGDVSGKIATALNRESVPRIVVVEDCSAEADGRLKAVYGQLRAGGFIRFTAHRTGQGVALVATRPAWLRQVA